MELRDCSGVEKSGHLAWLITKRSQVQILSPQLSNYAKHGLLLSPHSGMLLRAVARLVGVSGFMIAPLRWNAVVGCQSTEKPS